jgi:hypothetical protein
VLRLTRGWETGWFDCTRVTKMATNSPRPSVDGLAKTLSDTMRFARAVPRYARQQERIGWHPVRRQYCVRVKLMTLA